MQEENTKESFDQDQPTDPKGTNSSAIMDALFIGFLFGIVIFSVASNSWGFFTLIPLYLIYVFLKKGKANKPSQE